MCKNLRINQSMTELIDTVNALKVLSIIIFELSFNPDIFTSDELEIALFSKESNVSV